MFKNKKIPGLGQRKENHRGGFRGGGGGAEGAAAPPFSSSEIYFLSKYTIIL